MTKAQLEREVERLKAQVEILLKLAKEQGVRIEYVPTYPWYVAPYHPGQHEPWRITYGDNTTGDPLPVTMIATCVNESEIGTDTGCVPFLAVRKLNTLAWGG